MRIAVNLLPFRKHLGGAGNYAKHMIHELAAIDRANEYILFVTRENAFHFEVDNSRFHLKYCSAAGISPLLRILWEQIVLPVQLIYCKTDILFTPSVAIPVLFPGRMVTTIHDLAYLRIPRKYPFVRRWYVGTMTRCAVRRSQVVCTVSGFSRDEIISVFKLPPAKIIVTPNGVDDLFFQKVGDDLKHAVSAKYALPEKFILYVGAVEPSKNIAELLTAFSEIRKSGYADVRLVITNSIRWSSHDIDRKIRQEHLEHCVIFLPYVDESELPALYSLARFVVYLSDYEGFGLPVLEAMATGTPVLTSHAKAISEFAQGIAVQSNPFDRNELGKSFQQLLAHDLRPSLGDEGKMKASHYRWNMSAKLLYSTLIELQR